MHFSVFQAAYCVGTPDKVIENDIRTAAALAILLTR
jgi:hypothetical protein